MIDPLPSLRKLRDIYEGIDTAKKNHIKLLFIILMLSVGLFFYFVPSMQAMAHKNERYSKASLEFIDPLYKIGKGMKIADCAVGISCENSFLTNKVSPAVDSKILEMLIGFPMEEMVPALSKKEKEVSAYLVAIAKKESAWGKHAPKKEGRECYNYWGYRGKENTTNSGYSCFDSPEQAVEVVGNRIEKLLKQGLDTPAKMVVWKCGRDCDAAGGQAAADKWISDVKQYYDKINS